MLSQVIKPGSQNCQTVHFENVLERKSMEVNRIYLDMDGVLADFDRGVRELCGMEPLNQMTATEEDNNRLWAAIAKIDHFYYRLTLIPHAEILVRTLMGKYGERCEILTGIPKPRRNIKDAAEDKIRWIERYFGPRLKVNTVYRQEKKNYCHAKGDILIDDLMSTVRDWDSYGGTGILFTDVKSVMDKLRSMGVL